MEYTKIIYFLGLYAAFTDQIFPKAAKKTYNQISIKKSVPHSIKVKQNTLNKTVLKGQLRNQLKATAPPPPNNSSKNHQRYLYMMKSRAGRLRPKEQVLYPRQHRLNKQAIGQTNVRVICPMHLFFPCLSEEKGFSESGEECILWCAQMPDCPAV